MKVKLNKIDEVWNSANPLFKWRFGLLSSKNFATMQKDVTTSPLDWKYPKAGEY